MSLPTSDSFCLITSHIFNRHANVQHIDLKVPLFGHRRLSFGRGDISEDLKSMLITVGYSTSLFLGPFPYRSLESVIKTFRYHAFDKLKVLIQLIITDHNSLQCWFVRNLKYVRCHWRLVPRFARVGHIIINQSISLGISVQKLFFAPCHQHSSLY